MSFISTMWDVLHEFQSTAISFNKLRSILLIFSQQVIKIRDTKREQCQLVCKSCYYEEFGGSSAANKPFVLTVLSFPKNRIHSWILVFLFILRRKNGRYLYLLQSYFKGIIWLSRGHSGFFCFSALLFCSNTWFKGLQRRYPFNRFLSLNSFMNGTNIICCSWANWRIRNCEKDRKYFKSIERQNVFVNVFHIIYWYFVFFFSFFLFYYKIYTMSNLSAFAHCNIISFLPSLASSNLTCLSVERT